MLKLIIFLLLGIVITSQLIFDSMQTKVALSEPNFPAESALRLVDLGLDNVAADLCWLSMIQYYGDNKRTDFPKLFDYLSLTTNLDQKFSYAYTFAALNLPVQNQADQAIILAQRGFAGNDYNWELPYYLGTTYHLYKDDSVNAAKYLALAADTAGAPENIKYIAANYGTSTDKIDQTILLWQGIYETTKELQAQDKAGKYLEHLLIVKLLNNSSQEYFAKINKYPKEPSDLVSAGILNSIPPDPLGFSFNFDENGRIILE